MRGFLHAKLGANGEEEVAIRICNFCGAAVFCWFTEAKQPMNQATTDDIQREFGGTRYRPVLTAMILLLIALGMAVFAVWLGTAGGPHPRRSTQFYVVGISKVEHNRECI
jgi:hypothetical protein